jgi:hypothetical protein
MPKRPPCPGNPEDYVWVESKEKPPWRRKRGTVNAAKLNSQYQEAVDTTKLVSPAARRIRSALAPYLRGIMTGRLNNRICNAFRKSIKETGSLLLTYLKEIEIQRDYPLDSMLVCNYRICVDEKKVRIEIPIDWSSVKPFNNLVTDYYFEAVLLYGDVNFERALQTEHVESALYSFHTEIESLSVLEILLPEKEDLCLLLKISSNEGNELAVHTKHYRMKVVAGAGRLPG